MIASLRRRCIPALLTMVVLMLAGCGGDEPGVSAPKSTGKPKAATEPKSDADLTKKVGTALEPLVTAGCAYGVFAQEEAVHVDAEEELKWKTFPPASGTHFPKWADFGIFDEPVNDGYLVHNMEHGGVVAWLGDGVSTAQEKSIHGLVDKGDKWIVAPRTDLDGLAVNAWGKSLSCDGTALGKLEPDVLATAVDAWYDAVVSTGSEAEKDLAPYGGGLSEPSPTKNISVEAPF